ncbi:MAG: hypothetical protein JNM91_05355, partial [Flavobacteriales bacterium]|nr:hypothetical protein [Flavobacteriales bacterium]
MPTDRSFDPITPRKAGRTTATFVAVFTLAIGIFLAVGPVRLPPVWQAVVIGGVAFLA